MGHGPTFNFRAGVRLRDSVLACDARSGRHLTFLSHAAAGPVHGRRPVLTTDVTLALLGRSGERLRRHALVAAYGRPFSLGMLRLELFPSGHLPGAASLLCEVGGRRIVYAGAVGYGGGPFGTSPPEIRTAEAVCVDATFADPSYSFGPVADALATVRKFVEDALAAKRPPVLLIAPLGGAMDVAATLAAAGIALRAHRAVLEAAARYRAAGFPPPRLRRFEGRLGPNEALLWPPSDRRARRLEGLRGATFALVSGHAADAAFVSRLDADRGIPLSNRMDLAGLLGYVEATGAGEVALLYGRADAAAGRLRDRGLHAYVLGPPRQMDLFGQ